MSSRLSRKMDLLASLVQNSVEFRNLIHGIPSTRIVLRVRSGVNSGCVDGAFTDGPLLQSPRSPDVASIDCGLLVLNCFGVN